MECETIPFWLRCIRAHIIAYGVNAELHVGTWDTGTLLNYVQNEKAPIRDILTSDQVNGEEHRSSIIHNSVETLPAGQ